MNRLQKKCLIAVAGTHLFLLVLLLCSGFIRPRPKADDLQLLDVIPAAAIDAAFSSGVKGAQPPPPTPMITRPQPQPAPTPPPPKPVVTPPPPAPAPTLMQKVEKYFKPEPQKPPPDDSKPVEAARPKEHKIDVDLKPAVRRTTETSTSKSESRERQRQRNQELQRIMHNLKDGLSSATEIDLPGNSSASYANYGAIVVSVYHQAWIPPDNMANATSIVRFTVTISRDGSVISAHIVEPSGDTSVDNAVQRMLDRVTFIHEFPSDSKDRERTYSIEFNATRTTIQ